MIGALTQLAQGFLGRGEAAIAVPPFDGPLKPNQALERAQTLATLEAPQDLALVGDKLYVADGPRLLRLEAGAPVLARTFEAPLSALAPLPDGGLAVALDGREVRVYARPDDAEPRTVVGGLNDVNALAAARSGALYATEGAARGVDWAHDLMQNGRTGRLLRIEGARAEPLARGLRYAFGVAAMGEEALVAESWAHRLVAVDARGRTRPALTHLPVYPSRLTPAPGGGWWLTAFLARTLLVEFVLRERAFRKRMMAELKPEHWIAPRLSSGGSFLEPMQGAHLKTMGVVKPWAPPRSYGLVVRLDADARPLYSLHSRFDGVNHGIVAAAEANGALYLIAKGPRRLLRLPLDGLAQELT